jgi:IS30 family transposase
MEKKTNKRLSLQERTVIETLLDEKRSKTYIADRLNRSRSAITREINKWVGEPWQRYSAELAHWNAQEDYLNKRNLDKIGTHSMLRFYVYKGLLNGWSPEQVAGRIKLDYPEDNVMSISHEAIYMHIYSHPQARLNRKLIALLPYQKSRRRRASTTKKRRVRIPDQVSIDLRPKQVDERMEVGHWEGDLVIGAGQKSAIGTLNERKSRFTHIVKLKDRKAATVRRAFSRKLKPMNQALKKSLTYDNGLEMAQHKRLSRQTGMQVYFAHPYSSWERGTNENTNGLIRRFFPKGTDFRLVDERQLQEVQNKLNSRPRKVLGYKTPAEVLALETP